MILKQVWVGKGTEVGSGAVVGMKAPHQERELVRTRGVAHPACLLLEKSGAADAATQEKTASGLPEETRRASPSPSHP